MRKPRNQERGNVVIVAMLILVALISLGGLTTLSVQGGIAGGGHDRFRSIALYAAESGAAVTMDFLRKNLDTTTKWSALVNPNNSPLISPVGIVGNGAQPGDPDNLFSPEMRAWYEVEILNNLDDTDFVLGNDTDGRITVRVTGHGPGNTIARIEWDVEEPNLVGLGRPCPTYAQGGIDADGSGLNDCMGTITNTMTTMSVN